jgi:hypothetical protein
VPLSVLAGQGRLSWAEFHPVFEQLVEEIETASDEDTLPLKLSPDQVWVRTDGGVQLIGPALDAASSDADPERAMRFLAEVAVTAMEGAERVVEPGNDRIRAPLPRFVEDIFARLLGDGEPCRSPTEMRQELELLRDRPAEVGRWRRAGHLALSFLCMQLPVCGPAPGMFTWIALFALFLLWQNPEDNDSGAYVMVGYIAGCCMYWVVWAFAFRGGYLYWRGGIALRRADGRKASRLQCAFRALLVWGSIGAVYCLAVLVAHLDPTLPWLYFTIWCVGTVLLPFFATLALIFPTRSLHDRLAGTYLVPT